MELDRTTLADFRGVEISRAGDSKANQSAALDILGIAARSGAANGACAQGIEGVRPARAQVEILGGYGYLGSNTAANDAPINLNGASSAVGFYVRSWLGLVGYVGLYHQGSVAASGFSLTVSTFQVGPRLRWRNHTPLTTFGHLLLGAGHAGSTLYTRSLGPGLSPLGANNSFVLTGGGGVDWKLNPRIGIRLFQAEYLYSQFLNGSGNPPCQHL